MQIRLMFKNKDLNITDEGKICGAPAGWDEIAKDLEIPTILDKMSSGDKVVMSTCTYVMSHCLSEISDIAYRQENLTDAIHNAQAIRQLYDVTLETEKKIKEIYYWLDSNFLSSTFSAAVKRLMIYSDMLRKLRTIADEHISGFSSEGFTAFFHMLQNELSDYYLQRINADLTDLKADKGLLIIAVPGPDLQGKKYVLRKGISKGFWKKWLFAPSYTLAERDDSGAKDLGARCDRAINEPTNVLAQSAEHLSDFFLNLRVELSFYIGCINLYEALQQKHMPVCIPQLSEKSSSNRQYNCLYDMSLALTITTVTCNNLCSYGRNSTVSNNDTCSYGRNNTVSNEDKCSIALYMITGANQGGKTTFLRSIGQAQFMAQCGMFVAAESVNIPLREHIFTHFKKEEDSNIKSGKLDEELVRMDKIVSAISPHSLLLSNESFSSTNEREGSEIFRQITNALLEANVEIFAVTHLYNYAISYLDNKSVLFLRAQRRDDGIRTFKISEGKPLVTAYGKDLYDKIFS